VGVGLSITSMHVFFEDMYKELGFFFDFGLYCSISCVWCEINKRELHKKIPSKLFMKTLFKETKRAVIA